MEKRLYPIEGQIISVHPDSPIVVHKGCGAVFHMQYRAHALEGAAEITCPCCSAAIGIVREEEAAPRKTQQDYQDLFKETAW